MPSTIQLRAGDMFARPADLIIIPCSTGATITRMVAEKLQSFAINPPRKAMNLGDVEFQLFEGASSIATYVGYAASVAAMESNIDTVSKIAHQITDFVRNKAEIRDIAIPLLGAGAGGLTPTQSLLAIVGGLNVASLEDKVFNIFVFDESTYNSLVEQAVVDGDRSASVRHEKVKSREAVRVFISYTRTDLEHQEWVRDLAKYLRENGIDARLDIWHVRPGMDLPQWMSNEIELADRILIICNEDYAKRADGRIGGVGWEIRLVAGDLLQTQLENPKKYLPILHGSFDKDAVPRFLRGTYCMNWSKAREDHCKNNLLRELYEAYEEAPPLGSPPRFVLR